MRTWTHDRNHAPAKAPPLPMWKAIIVGLLGAAGAVVLVVAAAVVSIIALPILIMTGTDRGSMAVNRPVPHGDGPVIDAEYEVVETPGRSDDGSEHGARRSL